SGIVGTEARAGARAWSPIMSPSSSATSRETGVLQLAPGDGKGQTCWPTNDARPTHATNVGCVIVVEGDDLETVQRCHEGDPLNKVGVFGEVRIYRSCPHFDN